MKGNIMSSTKTHVSNLGNHGADVPTDLEGYTYTTVGEWLTVAKLDFSTSRAIDEDPEWAADWAREQAAAAVAALDAANVAVEAWQREGGSDD